MRSVGSIGTSAKRPVADRLCAGFDTLRHKYPILRRGRFLTGVSSEELGVKDVTWINAAGTEMRPEHWADPTMHCFGMLIDGRAQATGIRRPR